MTDRRPDGFADRLPEVVADRLPETVTDRLRDVVDRLPETVTDRLRDVVVDPLGAHAATGPWTGPATRAATAETTLVGGVLFVCEYAYAASELHLGGVVAGVATVFVGYALAFVVGAAALAADARGRGLPAPHPALAALLGVGLFVAAYTRPSGPLYSDGWDVVALATLSAVAAWTWRNDRRRAFWLACAGVAALLVAFSPVHVQARLAASGAGASSATGTLADLASVRIVPSWNSATLFGLKEPSIAFSWGGGSTWVNVPYALVGALLLVVGRRSARVRAPPDDASPSSGQSTDTPE